MYHIALNLLTINYMRYIDYSILLIKNYTYKIAQWINLLWASWIVQQTYLFTAKFN